MQMRSETPTFDFSQNCLFCSEIIQENNKLPTKRRKLVSRVETMEVCARIKVHGNDRHDSWGNDVIDRVRDNET